MSKHLDIMQLSTLNMLSTACGQGKQDEVRRALQAIIEGTSFGESSLDSKIVAEFEGVEFTEASFHEVIVYNGQRLKRHRNGGGWVPVDQGKYDEFKPFVADTAYVGPFAMVRDRARVIDNTVVMDNALVVGHAFMSGRAELSGNAKLGGSAVLIVDAKLEYGEKLSEGVYWRRDEVEAALDLM